MELQEKKVENQRKDKKVKEFKTTTYHDKPILQTHILNIDDSTEPFTDSDTDKIFSPEQLLEQGQHAPSSPSQPIEPAPHRDVNPEHSGGLPLPIYTAPAKTVKRGASKQALMRSVSFSRGGRAAGGPPVGRGKPVIR